MQKLQALSVASEFYPLAKTGGLADVAGALPGALAPHGVETHTLLPGYPQVMRRLASPQAVHRDPALFGGPATLLRAQSGPAPLFVLDAPHLFGREGLYGDRQGEWPDNPIRFAALCRVAALLAQGQLPGPRFDVVHLHDWQAALTAAYLHYDAHPRPAVVQTVHNLAFQGLASPDLLGRLGLPEEAWSVHGVESFGRIGALKAGLYFADRITTVSPTYAEEICLPAEGMGLDGLLRARGGDLTGILNGLDDTVWNPRHDAALAATYGPESLEARAANRESLLERFGLAPASETLLCGVISRLSEQKGLDLLLEIAPDLLGQGMRLVLLGAGDRNLEDGFADLARRFPEQVGLHLGYDEALAHLIQGGADVLCVPSRFEPCGLTQLAALRYGAVPLVTRVGGLADTVIDANDAALAAGAATGLHCAAPTAPALHAGFARALRLWRDRTAWRRMQENGMRLDVGWARPAARYARLYREAVAGRRL